MATFQIPASQDSASVHDIQARDIFWARYKEETKVYDKEIIEGSIGDPDLVLIFAGLFSAVNTAFIIESYKLLSPDPTNKTNAILSQILYKLNDSFTPLPIPAASTSPRLSSLAINVLLFSSLCFSLFTAFGAVLGKQWLYQYGRSEPASSDEEHGRQRQLKYSGIEQWHLLSVVESLPTLLQISLVLFQTALILFLWTINLVVGVIILALTSIPVAFFIFITFRSASYVDSPYQSVITRLFMPLFRQDGSSRYASDILDWHSFSRILHKSNDIASIEAAARSIVTCSKAIKDNDATLNRLCQILSHVSPEHCRPVERAIIHIGLICPELSQGARDSLAKLCNEDALLHSKELWNETHLFIASLQSLLNKTPVFLLKFANKYLSAKSSIPKWYLRVVTRAYITASNDDIAVSEATSALIETAFDLKPLPPLDDVVRYYMRLGFGFYPHERTMYTERDLIKGFIHTFELIGKNPRPLYFPANRIGSILKAFNHCSRDENYVLMFEQDEPLISSLRCLIPHMSATNDFTPLVAQALYPFALRQPWRFWLYFAHPNDGAEYIQQIDPHFVPRIIESCNDYNDESLMVSLLLLGSVQSQENVWRLTLSNAPTIVFSLFERLNIRDEAVGNVAFLLIAATGHILFSREDDLEFNTQLLPIYDHLSHKLSGLSFHKAFCQMFINVFRDTFDHEFPDYTGDDVEASTIRAWGVRAIHASHTGPARIDAEMPSGNAVYDAFYIHNHPHPFYDSFNNAFHDSFYSPIGHEFFHPACYRMIIIELCHNRRFVNLILSDEGIHLHNLFLLGNVLLDRKILDALSCLWHRCRTYNELYFLLSGNVSNFCKLLLQLCPMDIGSDAVFLAGLRAYADIHARSGEQRVRNFEGYHDELLARARLTREEFTALDYIDADYTCGFPHSYNTGNDRTSIAEQGNVALLSGVAEQPDLTARVDSISQSSTRAIVPFIPPRQFFPIVPRHVAPTNWVESGNIGRSNTMALIPARAFRGHTPWKH